MRHAAELRLCTIESESLAQRCHTRSSYCSQCQLSDTSPMCSISGFAVCSHYFWNYRSSGLSDGAVHKERVLCCKLASFKRAPLPAFVCWLHKFLNEPRTRLQTQNWAGVITVWRPVCCCCAPIFSDELLVAVAHWLFWCSAAISACQFKLLFLCAYHKRKKGLFYVCLHCTSCCRTPLTKEQLVLFRHSSTSKVKKEPTCSVENI